MTAAVKPGKLTQLVLLFQGAGVPDRDERILLTQALVKRPEVTSANDLTADEVHRLIRWLQDDPLIVDRARAHIAARPAARVRRKSKKAARCNLDGHTISAHDQAALDQFGAELAVAAQLGTSEAPPKPDTPPPGDGVVIKRYGPGCGPNPADGTHTVPAGPGIRHCPCGSVAQVPKPQRYCPPKTCWCGTCPWWTPPDPGEYARLVKAAVDKLAEKADRRAQRRR